MKRVENLEKTVNELHGRTMEAKDYELIILTDIALSLATIADTLKEMQKGEAND